MGVFGGCFLRCNLAMIWLFQNIGREPAVLRAGVVLIDDGDNAVVVRVWVPVNESRYENVHRSRRADRLYEGPQSHLRVTIQ